MDREDTRQRARMAEPCLIYPNGDLPFLIAVISRSPVRIRVLAVLANQWLTATNLIKLNADLRLYCDFLVPLGRNFGLSAQIEPPAQETAWVPKNLARLAPEGLRGAGQAMMLELSRTPNPSWPRLRTRNRFSTGGRCRPRTSQHASKS